MLVDTDYIRASPKLMKLFVNKFLYSASTVNGSPIKVYGEVFLSILFPGLKIQQKFHIIDIPEQNIIIGQDFLLNTSASINLANASITLCNDYKFTLLSTASPPKKLTPINAQILSHNTLISTHNSVEKNSTKESSREKHDSLGQNKETNSDNLLFLIVMIFLQHSHLYQVIPTMSTFRAILVKPIYRLFITATQKIHMI